MPATVITGALLWDGTGAEPVPGGAVRVEDGIIDPVGPVNEITLPGDRVLDFPGATIMPGLIDCHNHLAMDPELDNYLARMNDSVAEQTIRAVALMRRDLHAGVTTSRCCGDREFLDIACRDAAADNRVPGPRLLVAIRGIRAPHGHGFVGYPFDGPDEIRRAIDENTAAGADFIKIYVTGTLRGDGALPSFLTRDEIMLAVREAHESGMRVAAHCVGGIGLDWCLDAGLDSIEHAYHISDAQIERVAKSETRIVLTPSPYLHDGRVHRLPPELIPGHLAERDTAAGRMAAVIAAGLRFGLGTDGMHGGMAQEAAYLVELGASPAAAVQAATLHGAEICGVANETGGLECGKLADIIAVAGNPMRDIDALRRVSMVMKQGTFMSGAA